MGVCGIGVFEGNWKGRSRCLFVVSLGKEVISREGFCWEISYGVGGGEEGGVVFFFLGGRRCGFGDLDMLLEDSDFS